MIEKTDYGDNTAADESSSGICSLATCICVCFFGGTGCATAFHNRLRTAMAMSFSLSGG